MHLYYHTNRSQALTPGQTIECEPYQNESLITVFSPFMDAEFLHHLQELQRTGLSLHGARYLIQLDKEVIYPEFAIEIYYEYSRWKNCPHKPSRLQSFFCWRNLQDAIDFAKECGQGRVYEVRCDKSAGSFVGDMNALKLSFDQTEQETYAKRYWTGKPLRTDVGYVPRWECLVNLPVEVVREVLVKPSDGRPG